MLNKTNLHLLGSQLEEIAETPYFSDHLNEYLNQLRKVVESTLEQYSALPTDVLSTLTNEIGSITKFLAGSTSKRIPYEIVYSLRLGLNSWINKNAIITTAISPDFRSGFYFQGVNQQFNILAKSYLDIDFNNELVQISLPQLYRHRPLYNIPLFHELGHFLDTHHQITSFTLMLDANIPLPNVDPKTLNPAILRAIQTNHRMEYFADIYAASYIGRAYHKFLESFAPNNPASMTHPATLDRLTLINKFLNSESDILIDLFNKAIMGLNLPELKINFVEPNIEDCFSNFRPYSLASDAEVHGIFSAAWIYLEKILAKPDGAWKVFTEAQIEKTINNLVEKSIRNRMVIERWSSGSNNTQ
ncbi:MAG: hypothetical protein ACO1N8_05070 [Methylophilus sp.]